MCILLLIVSALVIQSLNGSHHVTSCSLVLKCAFQTFLSIYLAAWVVFPKCLLDWFMRIWVSVSVCTCTNTYVLAQNACHGSKAVAQILQALSTLLEMKCKQRMEKSVSLIKKMSTDCFGFPVVCFLRSMQDLGVCVQKCDVFLSDFLLKK